MSDYTYVIGFERLGIDLGILRRGRTACPKCSHTRKKKHDRCLWVSVKTGHYYCHNVGCVYNQDGLRVDSDQYIIDQRNKGNKGEPIKATKSELERIERFKRQQAKQKKIDNAPPKPFSTTPPTEAMYKWFQGRGISKETVDNAGTRSAGNAIAFNYFNPISGKAVNAKYRKVGKKAMWQHKNAPERHLYRIDRIYSGLPKATRSPDAVIITEGEADCLTWEELGYYAVSISQGAPSPNANVGDKLECFNNDAKYLKGKEIYIDVDDDDAGRYLEKILINRFGYNCHLIRHENGVKDANEAYLANGAEALHKAFDDAKKPQVQGATRIDDVWESILQLRKTGFKVGERYGWASVDEYLPMNRGVWEFMFGMGGMGKSEAIKHRIFLSMWHLGWKWAVFSPEHHPATEFYAEFIEFIMGKKIAHQIRDPDTGKVIQTIPNCTPDEIRVCKDFLKRHLFFIYPSDRNDKDIMNTPTEVLNLASDLVLCENIDGLIIDPYNQMIPESRGEMRDVYLGKVLGKVDEWVKKHNTLLIFGHHPSASSLSKNADGNYNTPDVYSPNGKTMWNNKAYLQTAVHRPYKFSNPQDSRVIFNVQKVKKEGRMGKIGEIELNFDRQRGWYYDIDATDAPMWGIFEQMLKDADIETEEAKQDREFKGSNLNNFGMADEEVPF